ncbi:MAG: glycosyltransferase family protein [Candidatus Aquicultorales bacterium]
MRLNLWPNVDKMDGCVLYRMKVPATLLEANGHSVRFRHKEDLDYDALVVHRCYNNRLDSLISTLKDHGLAIIYDTDDLLEKMEQVNIDSPNLRQEVSYARNIVREADLVTVSTPYLAERVGRIARDKPVVLPNSLPLSVMPRRSNNKQRLRVGFEGGFTHIFDLLIVLPVIEQLKKEIDFDFVSYGISDTGLSGYIDFLSNQTGRQADGARMLRKFLTFEFEDYEWKPIESHWETLAGLDLDIGLAPLADTEFNRAKSALKYYEYAAVGTTTLASQVTPYREELNYTAKNTFKDWHRKLKQLLLDESLREELYQEQYEFVAANRDIEKTYVLWEEAYEACIAKTRATRV